MSAPLLLSCREAARLLGIGRCNTLPALIKEGKIRSVSIAGRTRIPREEVERVAREGTEAAPTAPQKRERREKTARAAELAKVDEALARLT